MGGDRVPPRPEAGSPHTPPAAAPTPGRSGLGPAGRRGAASLRAHVDRDRRDQLDRVGVPGGAGRGSRRLGPRAGELEWGGAPAAAGFITGPGRMVSTDTVE